MMYEEARRLVITCPQCGRAFSGDGLHGYERSPKPRPASYQCPLCGYHPCEQEYRGGLRLVRWGEAAA